MTVSTIPVQSGTDAFTQQVELDLSVFDLTFKWNERDAHWSMDIGGDTGPLLFAVKLVVSTDLLTHARRIAGLPPGRLFVTDLDGLDRDPDGELFGNRVVLQYEGA